MEKKERSKSEDTPPTAEGRKPWAIPEQSLPKTKKCLFVLLTLSVFLSLSFKFNLQSTKNNKPTSKVNHMPWQSIKNLNPLTSRVLFAYLEKSSIFHICFVWELINIINIYILARFTHWFRMESPTPPCLLLPAIHLSGFSSNLAFEDSSNCIWLLGIAKANRCERSSSRTSKFYLLKEVQIRNFCMSVVISTQ